MNKFNGIPLMFLVLCVFLISLNFVFAFSKITELEELKRAVEMENIHLKEELKKANSDTTHKHCIKNYKP